GYRRALRQTRSSQIRRSLSCTPRDESGAIRDPDAGTVETPWDPFRAWCRDRGAHRPPVCGSRLEPHPSSRTDSCVVVESSRYIVGRGSTDLRQDLRCENGEPHTAEGYGGEPDDPDVRLLGFPAN